LGPEQEPSAVKPGGLGPEQEPSAVKPGGLGPEQEPSAVKPEGLGPKTEPSAVKPGGLGPNRELAAVLLDKYREMRRMRKVDEATPAVEEGAPDPARPSMRALAARFPGALREIDELPMEEIEARISALETAVQSDGPLPAWAGWATAYHGWLRVALQIKRRSGRRTAEEVAAELPAWYRPGPGEPDPSELDPATVAAILRPPGGRLNPWVFARVGAKFSVSAEAVEAAIFRPRGSSNHRTS
ncbi:MAG: hypothetical protein AAGF12_27335, partial [Myxococcota bacterium]